MPSVEIVFYMEDDGSVPMSDWLDGLQLKHRAKCLKWIGILRSFGYDLRRPECDYLRDGIYELRVRFQSLNYRMLYFFYVNQVVVLTHGLKKEKEVPPKEIDRAVDLKKKFEADPQTHTFRWKA
ncbi:MAG: type II toxin-antitoxin system RelE/ParE family toxin [Thermodesulfobacteriota bacterium]